MADTFVPSKANAAFADISSFVADANAINAATKTALNLGLTNISNLFAPSATPQTGASHPDFNKIDPTMRAAIQLEIATLIAAVTAHA